MLRSLIAGVALIAVVGYSRQPRSVQRVQPGTVSLDDRNETFPAIDPIDGALWFSVYADDFGEQTIMTAPLRGDTWGPATIAPVSGRWSDRAPRFSPDGLHLFITSNRPFPGSTTRTFHVWMSERTGTGEWSEPVPAPTGVNSTDGWDIHPSVLADGTVWVASTRTGTLGRSDLFRVSSAGVVTHIGAPINDEYSQPDVYVDPDGTWMILAVTDRPDGLGGDDLYLSRFASGEWSTPVNLRAPVNGPEYEYGPTVSPDGAWLYFTSHRGGSADVYRVSLDDILNEEH